MTGSRRATAVGWASVTALSLAGAVLTVLAWSDLVTKDAVSDLSSAPAAVLYATLGALIVRRAGNVIGWLLLGIGAGLAIMPLASAYAVLGITHPGTLPAPELVGLLAECSFVPIFAGIGFMLLLFPSGTLPSPRWRPFAGLSLLATALTMAGFVVRPGLVALPAPDGTSLTFANPLGITSLGPALSTVLIGTFNGLAVLGTVLLAAAFVSLAVRYRPGGREVRQQIKWIALAAVAGTGCQIAALLAIAATGDASNPVTVAAYVVWQVITVFGIPAIITLAILKHGLYQIDVIINRAIMYGLLSATLTAVYVGIVVGIGTLAGYAGGPVLTVAAALAIAVLFQPRAAAGPARREPARVRAAGHALPGALRLRPGHGRAAGRRRGTGPDGVGAGRRHRRGPGRGLGPGRGAAAPAGDLAARIHPARRRPAHRRWRSCRPSTPRRGRSRSGTPASCSARSPWRSRGTSRCRPPRTSCLSTWPPRRAWSCATSA